MPPPPIDWNERNSIRDKGGEGLVYAIYFIIYPLVMTFNVQENVVFIPEFLKKSLYRG